MEEKAESSPRQSTGKLRRQLSRLQMHAPSSIQVAPPPQSTAATAAARAAWNVDPIPLLSPLDAVPIPWEASPQPPPPPLTDGGKIGEEKEAETIKQQQQGGGSSATGWRPWRHPAMPFHYEPPPPPPATSSGTTPALLLPHCR